MNRVRIWKLKREAGAWSIRFRCPRAGCRGDFSVWVRIHEGCVKEIAPEDERVWAYARGEGTAEELGARFGVDASTIGRNVDRALNDVTTWIHAMSGYLGRQAPEFLAVLLSVVASPADEGSWQRRRFRKAGRIRHVQLLTHLPDWVQACQEDLHVAWPYGHLHFLRRVVPRLLANPP